MPEIIKERNLNLFLQRIAAKVELLTFSVNAFTNPHMGPMDCHQALAVAEFLEDIQKDIEALIKKPESVN